MRFSKIQDLTSPEKFAETIPRTNHWSKEIGHRVIRRKKRRGHKACTPRLVRSQSTVLKVGSSSNSRFFHPERIFPRSAKGDTGCSSCLDQPVQRHERRLEWRPLTSNVYYSSHSDTRKSFLLCIRRSAENEHGPRVALAWPVRL